MPEFDQLAAARWTTVGVALAVLATGCSRTHFRNRADKDVEGVTAVTVSHGVVDEGFESQDVNKGDGSVLNLNHVSA